MATELNTEIDSPLPWEQNEKGREYYIEERHASLDELRRRHREDNQYIVKRVAEPDEKTEDKDIVPHYPRPVEFHVSRIAHVTTQRGLDGILDEGGLKRGYKKPFVWWGLVIGPEEIARAEERYLDKIFPDRTEEEKRREMAVLEEEEEAEGEVEEVKKETEEEEKKGEEEEEKKEELGCRKRKRSSGEERREDMTVLKKTEKEEEEEEEKKEEKGEEKNMYTSFIQFLEEKRRKQMLEEMEEDEEEEEKRSQEPFLRKFTSSPVFKNGSRYGNFRFSFSLEEVLQAYSTQFCGGKEPVLRVRRTSVYKQEIMYSVLVHSPAVDRYNNYPILGDNEEGVCAYRNGEIIWRAQAISETHSWRLTENRQERQCYAEYVRKKVFYLWDHVTLAFHMPVLSFPRENLIGCLTACGGEEPAYNTLIDYDEAKRIVDKKKNSEGVD